MQEDKEEQEESKRAATLRPRTHRRRPTLPLSQPAVLLTQPTTREPPCVWLLCLCRQPSSPCLWVVTSSLTFYDGVMCRKSWRGLNEAMAMMMKAILVFHLAVLIVLASQVSGKKVKKKQIYLAGTFPINGSEGWQGGQACLPAALLALEDVNREVVLHSDQKIFSVSKSG